MPSKIEKIEKLSEIIYGMRPEVGQYCWNATLSEKKINAESPLEISSAQNELENENVQKICLGLDQMYIEQEFDSEDDEKSAEAIEEAEEMVTLVLVPEEEENQPEKRKIQSKLTNYFVKK